METVLKRPWVTVIVAAYNSERFIHQLAQSLSEQAVPSGVGPMEVIFVDGGSTDNTVAVARELGYTVVNNPAGHAISAKAIGFREATSQFVCFLDHDETFEKTDSLKRRYELFEGHPRLRAITSAGYKFNRTEPTSNLYASEFGDPVSLVSYRSPNSVRFREQSLLRHLQTVHDDGDSLLFAAGSENRPILCELVAGTGMMDRDYFAEVHPELFVDQNFLPHAYYRLGNGDLIAMIRGDAVIHDSAESWSVVRAKISWRVTNAVLGTDISASGFSGRQPSPLYNPARQKLRFFLYAASVVLPLADGVWLAFTRRRIGYLNHFFLTYFVVYKAVALRLRAFLGSVPKPRRYGS